MEGQRRSAQWAGARSHRCGELRRDLGVRSFSAGVLGSLPKCSCGDGRRCDGQRVECERCSGSSGRGLLAWRAARHRPRSDAPSRRRHGRLALAFRTRSKPEHLAVACRRHLTLLERDCSSLARSTQRLAKPSAERRRPASVPLSLAWRLATSRETVNGPALATHSPREARVRGVCHFEC